MRSLQIRRSTRRGMLSRLVTGRPTPCSSSHYPGATREPSPFCCPACRSGALRSFTSSEDLPAARRSVCYTVVGHHRFPSTLGVIPSLAARVMQDGDVVEFKFNV